MNILKFGDVIFFDGTKICNPLNWEAFPITLIDNNRELISGGVFFLGLETTEVFDWTLKIMNERTKQRFETLFTDEDSALMVSIPKFSDNVRGIAHYICTFHKYNNIKKHISQQDLPKKTKQVLTDYATQLCFDSDPIVAEEALRKMEEIAPSLSLYFLNLRRIFNKFSYSAKGDNLTLGYNTTSPAESFNKMIKSYLPARTLSLKEIRTYISSSFEFKKKSNSFGQYRFTTNQINLRNMIQIPISAKIFNIIEEEYNGTKHLYLIFEDNDIICVDNDRHYKIFDNRCTCGFTTCYGLPCRHLIFFHQKISGYNHFPSFLINQRWYTDSSPPPPANQIIFCTSISDFDSNSDYDSDFVQEEDSSDSYEFCDELPDLDSNEDIIKMSSTNASAKYTQLFYKGKELARLGSINETWFRIVNNEFDNMLNQLISEPHKIKTVEQEALSQRGRPRKKGYSNPTVARSIKCPICKQMHDIKSCKYYKDLQKNVKNYKGKNKGNKKCPICGYFDHSLNKCPPLIQTKFMINN